MDKEKVMKEEEIQDFLGKARGNLFNKDTEKDNINNNITINDLPDDMKTAAAEQVRFFMLLNTMKVSYDDIINFLNMFGGVMIKYELHKDTLEKHAVELLKELHDNAVKILKK